MNFKLVPLVAFIICQAYPTWSQLPGINPTQPLTPGNWMGPMYTAAADAWREYFARVQQATNQMYQQWANFSGNPFGNGGFGGLGGFYGIPGSQQNRPQNRPPLQGIFSPSAGSGGFQLGDLLPAGQRPGASSGGRLEDEAQELQPPPVPEAPKPAPQQQVAPARQPQQQSGSQARPQATGTSAPRAPQAGQSGPQQVVPGVPSVQQVVPVQAQQIPQVPVQPQQVQQAVPVQPQQVPAAPLQGLAQGLGQAGSPVGLFSAPNGVSWMG